MAFSADGSILDVLSGHKEHEFSILVDAVKKAGMEEILAGRESSPCFIGHEWFCLLVVLLHFPDEHFSDTSNSLLLKLGIDNAAPLGSQGPHMTLTWKPLFQPGL